MDLKSGIVLFLAVGAVVAIDYCNNMRCGSKPHVACNSPAANDGWGPECPGDQKLIEINQEMKDRILDILNGQRNQQALGKTPNYDSASRMGTLLWDDGLAEMAEYNARLCHYGHDPCHNTKKWYPSGQNIANSQGRTDDKQIIESLVPMWFADEAQNGYIVGWMDTINSFTDSPDPNVVIGHFTQVVWEDAAVVGCAGVKYTDAAGKEANLICNFGYGNLAGNYVYQSGPPGSKCKTGTNPKYPGLCSEKEDYSDSILKRSGWDLKKIPGPNGGYSWNIPPGCDDDPDCRELQANPSAFFAKNEKPGDSKPVEGSYSIDPSGRVKFRYPGGCDQACKDRVHAKLAREHPEYAQPSGSSGSSGKVEGSYSIGPDGTAHFMYPSGCDQACKDRVMKKLVDEHPEYGK